MIEVDLNNGMFREIDLNRPVFCSKCGKEIVREKNSSTINLVINVHTCGCAFCGKCKKELNAYAGEKVAEYEKKLVEDFVNDGKRKADV